MMAMVSVAPAVQYGIVAALKQCAQRGGASHLFPSSAATAVLQYLQQSLVYGTVRHGLFFRSLS